MKEATFKELLESIEQFKAIRAGRMQPSRVIRFDPPRVKAIRKKLRVSQTRFAALIGISAGTLRNWEQGRTRPVGPARVLLKIAERRPRAVIEALMPERSR